MPQSQLAHYRSRLSEKSLRLSKALYSALASKPTTRTTVFVGGVQRSGTNMLMQVLERSFATDVFHESDARAFDGYQLRDRSVIHGLVERSKAPVVTFKPLCDLEVFRELMDEFAPAKGIWLFRDYHDVVNSHVALWTKMPYYLGEVLRDPDNGEAGWRARGLSRESRDTLARVYHPDMDNPTACALFWYLRNTLLFDQGLHEDSRVAIIEYEDMVANPDERIPALCRFLGIPYRDYIARLVSSSSIRKRAQPEIEPAVRELCQQMQEKLRGAATIP